MVWIWGCAANETARSRPAGATLAGSACRETLRRRGSTQETSGRPSAKLSLHDAIRRGDRELLGKLLRSDRDVNAADPNGHAPLHVAALLGQEQMARALLANKADADIRTRTGRTPLHLAVEAGSPRTVAALLAGGARADPRDNDGRSPWEMALGDPGEAKGAAARVAAAALVIHAAKPKAGKLLSARDGEGRTLLHLAAEHGNFVLAKDLLRKGAPVDGRDRHGMTPLHYTYRGGHTEMMRLLVAKGADVNAKDGTGLTMLIVAAGERRDDTVRLLLSLGARVDIFSACSLGQADRVREILRADPKAVHAAVGPTNSLPIHSAAVAGRADIVKLLLQKGADVDATTDGGATALLHAAAKGHLDVVRLLIRKAARVGVRAAPLGDVTALHAAAYNGHPAVVRILVGAGAQVGSVDIGGETALHSAAKGGEIPTADLLIRLGAEVNAKSHAGRTPLDEAADEKMAQFLRKRGAKTGKQLGKGSPRARAMGELKALTAGHCDE